MDVFRISRATRETISTSRSLTKLRYTICTITYKHLCLTYDHKPLNKRNWAILTTFETKIIPNQTSFKRERNREWLFSVDSFFATDGWRRRDGNRYITMLKQVTCRWMQSWRTRHVMRRIQYASSATLPATLCRDIAGTKTASSSTPQLLDPLHCSMVIGSTSRQHRGDPGKQVITHQNLFVSLPVVYLRPFSIHNSIYYRIWLNSLIFYSEIFNELISFSFTLCNTMTD